MRTNVKLTAVAVLACLVFGVANVYADYGRNKTGAPLTYLLNGSPVFKGAIASYDAGYADNSTTNGGTGYTAFGLDNTSYVVTQCDADAFVGAAKSDAGLSNKNTLYVFAREKFPLGMLQPGNPFVSVAAADAGRVNCGVWEYK